MTIGEYSLLTQEHEEQFENSSLLLHIISVISTQTKAIEIRRAICCFLTLFCLAHSLWFSGPLGTPQSSAPEKMAADGGTTAVTQPTPTEDTTGAAPTPDTWPSTAQMTA